MNEKEILIPASIIKENKDSYTVSIPGIGFNTEKNISKEGVVILEEKETCGRKSSPSGVNAPGALNCQRCGDYIGFISRDLCFKCGGNGYASPVSITITPY